MDVHNPFPKPISPFFLIAFTFTTKNVVIANDTVILKSAVGGLNPNSPVKFKSNK